jgi:hypothetical protein
MRTGRVPDVAAKQAAQDPGLKAGGTKKALMQERRPRPINAASNSIGHTYERHCFYQF